MNLTVTDSDVAADNWADSEFYGKDLDNKRVAEDYDLAHRAYAAGHQAAIAQISDLLERMGISR